MAPNRLTIDPAPRTELRRSSRFSGVVPVRVNWREPTGREVQEDAQATGVNAQGGLLQMKTYPAVGCQVELINLDSRGTAQARIVAMRRSKEGTLLGVAVQLLAPSEAFWGVNFQLRKTSAALLELEQALRYGSVDPRVLRHFRDAVDYIRKTAWAVQEWQERQHQMRDTATVLPLLTAERIRRTTELSDSVTTDLEAHEVTYETAGVDDLFRAVERLYQHLAGWFRGREAK